MSTVITESPISTTWVANLDPPRFDAAERKLEQKVAQLREAEVRERAIERTARDRALFQLD